MSGWHSSDRKWELPPDWTAIRNRVLRRDGYRCRWILPSGKRCPRGRTTGHRLEVDHRGDPMNHSEANLQTLCVEHHARKTHGESKEARVLPPVERRTEKHPSERRRP